MSLNRPLTPEEQARIDRDYLSIQAQQNSNDAHPMFPKKGLGIDPSTGLPTEAVQTPGIGGPSLNSFDSIQKPADEILSLGTDSAGKSIGGVTAGQAVNVAAEGIKTGDARQAATSVGLQVAGTAAGTAVAGPIGGMIGGAMASTLTPKKKKKLEHLV